MTAAEFERKFREAVERGEKPDAFQKERVKKATYANKKPVTHAAWMPQVRRRRRARGRGPDA